MTVLTFPTNPTLGQQYAAPNGIQYVFDGVKWIVETTSSSSAAVTNSTQDRVAPMFVDGTHDGITFSYNAATNVMSAEVTAVNGDSLVNGVHELTLESTGATTFPTLTVPLEDNANPVGTGQVLQFGDSTQQAIIFGPVSTATNTSAERVIIQGAPGYTGTTGEGGDVYVWAGPGGSTNGQGGDIKVRAGRGNGTGTGGYLNFQAGDSNTGNGGYINIESGSTGTYGSGGDITVEARSGGEITLRTQPSTGANNNWLFGTDGDLTLPNGMSIDSYGTLGENAFLEIGGDDTRIGIDNDGAPPGLTITTNGTAGMGQKQWRFGPDGDLTFPDNTVQTTAYTGQTSSSGELYIMANVDGNIVTSTNGIDWTAPQASGLPGIQRVEIHNGVIVYISGGEMEGSVRGLYYSTEIGTVTLCAGTDISTETDDDLFWQQVHYFAGSDKWVAVGYNNGDTNKSPVLAHSDNGITWTVVFVDNTFVTGFNTEDYDWLLTDVAWLDETNQYVITSFLDGPGATGGIFITEDITVALDGTTHVAIDFNARSVVPWSVVGFGGPSGYMILLPSVGGSNNILSGWGTDPELYDDSFGLWESTFIGELGYAPALTEVAYKNGDFIAVTNDGQVATIDFNIGGPALVISIPLPYTNTVFSISNANPAVITWGMGNVNEANNEKIVVTLAGEYNGTYYVDTGTRVLYTDLAMTTALDASGFAAFTSGTVTFSHGQYFDAAGASNSYYYIGNDDEQVFRSSNGITWTQQADFTGEYFNDFAYGSFGSAVSASTLVNGDQTFTLNSDGSITFPDGSIQTTAYTGSGAADNVWIQTFVTATPATDVVQVATSVEYDSAGNIVSLFSHVDPSDSSTYYSVGKYTTTGTRIWTTRFGAEFNTDGWGLAVDSTSGFVYIAGKTNTDGGQFYSTLTKISGVDGTIEWSKKYDFGFDSSSAVVDVDPDGNPVMVGYASNGDDRYVTTTKVDAADGTIIWSRALDGQGDDEAYGMAVGPSGEIVTVGYMAQLVSPLANSVATAVTEPVSNVNWITNTNVFTNGVNFNVTFNAGVPTIVINSDSEGDWTVGNTIGTISGSLVGGTDGIDDMVVKVDTVITDTDDRMLVVKYASNGTIAWQKAVRFDTGYDSFGADADIDSAGNIYVCGMYENDLGGPLPQSMSIVKFNSMGVKQWSRRVNGNCGGWTSSIVVGPDDKLYLSATTFSGDNPGNVDLHTVVAKYELDGTVAWQRLLDYTDGASLGAFGFGSSSGGSNLAVKQDYVAIGLGFSSDPNFGAPGTFHAAVAQLPAAGDLFAVGSWDFKTASFSGTLSSDASQIEVVNSTKTDFDNASNIDTTTVTPDFDSGEFLIGTVFTNATSDADLVGNGHQASIGYKYTVYTDSQGYQGGEETGVILKDNLSHPYTVGDLITFRNGEQKSITSVQTGYSDTWVQWSGPVDGSDSNPRFPITVQSSIYTPETKPTARIKPDLGEAIAHDHYMKIYAGAPAPGTNPTDPGTPSVMDSLHIHMAGAQENVELFLGTDANYVSTKEAGDTPAGVRLHSEVDVSVVNTNLRLDRKGSTWVSVYGDGENKNLYNNGYDLSWSTIAVDDHGDYYVGGEDNNYATAIINKYSRDGQLIWSKYNDGDDYNGWQFDGVAYHNGQVATLVQTATGRVNDYYKLSVLDSSTGDLISTTDIYDPDGNLEAHSMIHHSTLGWTVVGNTEGEVGTTAAITDTNNPNDYDAIRLLASACLIDGRYPANGQGWRITGTNITGGQNFNTGVGFFQNRPVVAVTGTGVDAYATVYIDYNANTYNMDVVTSVGSGFAIGDTVKILGSQLGGVDGVNDFTFTCQSNGGLNSYDNYAGTPSRQYIWIDMNVAGGYVDTAFKDGTFTLTRRRSNRPWIWTNEWTRFLNPTPISSDPYAGGQAFCVAEDPLTHDLVVGGYIDTFDNSGTFVWKLNDAGATQWAKTINSDNSSVRGIAVSGLDSSIYVSTNYIYVHKLSSSGDLTKTVSNYGMWGVSQPEIKLAIEEDGFEYVYVGGSGSAIWSNSRDGFFLNKLTTDLVTVWGRGMWHTEDDLSIDYDIEHTNFVLGKGQASIVGFGNPYSLDNTNALIYTISTGDQFEPVDILGWQAIQNGGQVWNTDTGLSMYNILTAGAQAVTATASTETQTDSLSWTNYAFQSKLINLNTVKRGIVGVETIEFNDGGTLDHNPADIPPSVLFDPSNSSWEYTLQLSDRGRFILNQTIPNDSPCQDLFVYVPRNDQVAFPVGTVITLINASSAEAGGEHIYVRPINYADGNGWVRIWAVGGDQNPSQWRFQGIQTATLMKISTNGWLLTANNIINDD